MNAQKHDALRQQQLSVLLGKRQWEVTVCLILPLAVFVGLLAEAE